VAYMDTESGCVARGFGGFGGDGVAQSVSSLYAAQRTELGVVRKERERRLRGGRKGRSKVERRAEMRKERESCNEQRTATVDMSNRQAK
jgi:hypothetical protein